MEAADDICYEVMDLEDAHKLRILPLASVVDVLLGFFDDERRAHIEESMKRVSDPNEQVAYLRSCVVGVLVDRCAETFIANEDAILAGTFEGPLLQHIPELERKAFERCSALSWEKIYCASEVVDVELAGNRIISFLMERLVGAVVNPELNYSRLLLAKFPEQ